MEWNEVGQVGEEQNIIETYGMEYTEVKQSGVELSRMRWKAMECDVGELNEVEWK